MKRQYLASLLVCGIVAFAADAGAQTAGWGNSGYISLNSLYQTTPLTFTTTSTLDVNQESGEVRTGHRIAPGFVYDVTDPVLRPLRNLIPAVRMGAMAMDFSPILLFIVIVVVQRAIGCTGIGL